MPTDINLYRKSNLILTIIDQCTVGSKIIRALEIVRIKKLIPDAPLLQNIYQNIRLYTVDNKHEIIKFHNQIRGKIASITANAVIILLPAVNHTSRIRY